MHTYTVSARAILFRSPRQISKTKRDGREISSPLWEIGVAEDEYDVRFFAGSSYTQKIATNPKIAQKSVRAYFVSLR